MLVLCIILVKLRVWSRWTTMNVLLCAAPLLVRAAPLLVRAAPLLLCAAPLLLHAAPLLLCAAPLLRHAAPLLLHAAPLLGHAAPLLGHAAPLLLPLEQLMEQRLALLLRKVRNRGTLILLLHTSQHLLGDAPAGPAGNGRRKIDIAPFWMAVRFLKLVPLGKKGLGKPPHTPVAIGIFLPVENRENRRHRDSVDRLPLRNQRPRS
jgi:hypothetical protein